MSFDGKLSAVFGRKLMSDGKRKTVTKGRTIDDLPNEILQKIFSWLDVASLLNCACTCCKWMDTANDNQLWKVLFQKHVFPKEKLKPQKLGKKQDADLHFTEGSEENWKKKFFTKCKQIRNKRFRALDKINSFTGVTNHMDEVLWKLGVEFELCLTLKDGNYFSFKQRKRKSFDSTTVVQWYGLDGWPTLDKIASLTIYSLTPIIFGNNKRALPNGPCQRSLLVKENVQQHFKKEHCLSDSAEIELLKTGSNIFVALWKDTDDFALVCVGLHHHNLLKKCLYSTSDSIYHTLHELKPDDVDVRYGLHSYKCHIHVHTMGTSIWNESFTCLFCKDTGGSWMFDGFISFELDGYGCNNKISSDMSIKWRTDLFKGAVKNITMLTLTMCDINSDVIWNFSSPVKIQTYITQEVNFDCAGNSCKIEYSDCTGRVVLHLGDSEDFFILQKILIYIKMNVINGWFGTSHGIKK